MTQPISPDGRCTDCDDTGITIQTERRCACQPVLPASPDEGDALKAAGRLRYVGETPTDEQRRHVRQSELYQHGDAWLVWVNEGDLHQLSFDALIRARTDPPVAMDEVVALERVIDLADGYLQERLGEFHNDDDIAVVRAILTRIKDSSK